jgi:hypothetical protein
MEDATMTRHWQSLGVVVLALAACHDPLGPAHIEGAYQLTRINGVVLPYDHEGLGCCTYLNGRLELSGGRYTIEITARNRNTSAVFTVSEEGTYERTGNTLTFTRETYVIQPLLLDRATVVGHVIALSFGGEGPGSPDQFDGVFEIE